MPSETKQNLMRSTVAQIRLNRPDKPNAVNTGMIDEIAAALREAEDDDEVGVLLLSGNRRAFLSGSRIRSIETSSRTHL